LVKQDGVDHVEQTRYLEITCFSAPSIPTTPEKTPAVIMNIAAVHQLGLPGGGILSNNNPLTGEGCSYY
jgi:hypothetical protein